MRRMVCTEVALFDGSQHFAVLLFLDHYDLGQRVRPTMSKEVVVHTKRSAADRYQKL